MVRPSPTTQSLYERRMKELLEQEEKENKTKVTTEPGDEPGDENQDGDTKTKEKSSCTIL